MAQTSRTAACLDVCIPEYQQDAPPSVDAARGESLAMDTEMLVQKPPVTLVPKLQLATLCLVRLVDPISFTQIFPYVNEMMQDLGVAHSASQRSSVRPVANETVGLLVDGFPLHDQDSLFAISQMLSIYHWAKLSDVIGRRPVILTGVVGVAFATILFGLSDTFFWVLLSRCLAGFLAGNIATIHAVLGEITDASNQAVAFPLYGLCFPLGSIIGPLIGGTFSHPAEKFELFRDLTLFAARPYFLPCLISAIISLCGASLGWLCLEETLPSKRVKFINGNCSRPRFDTIRTYGTMARGNVHEGEPEDSPSAVSPHSSGSQTGVFTLLAIPTVRALAASGFALSFLGGAFDVVFALFCYSPISTGGLGYPAAQIGYAFAIAGGTAVMLQILAMPTILRKVTPVTAYKFCMKLWPIAYLFLPLLNIIARLGLDEHRSEHDTYMLKPAYTAAIWIGIGVCLAITRVSNLGYAMSMILVKETCPNPGALGAANGLAQLVMCMARAIAPAFVSVLFATSVKNNILHSYFWALIMACLGVVGSRVSAQIHLQEGHPKYK